MPKIVALVWFKCYTQMQALHGNYFYWNTYKTFLDMKTQLEAMRTVNVKFSTPKQLRVHVL